MSKEFIPSICGDDNIYIPDTGCDDCDRLEARVKDLEDTRLVQSDIIAGDNITVEYAEDSNEVTINADLSNQYTKAEVDELLLAIETGGFKLVDTLPATGENGYIYLVPNTPPETGYEQYIWTDNGWVDLGKEEITLDKASILTALGYEETTISMTSTAGNTVTQTILVEIQTPTP